MREFHEVRKRLSEHPEDAAPYVVLARRILGDLKLDMSRNGLLQGVRRREVDGVLIEVASVFGQDVINIIPSRPPQEKPGKKPIKEIVFPRWVFCTPVAAAGTAGGVSNGSIYIHDAPSSEPRLIAEFSKFGEGYLANYLGWFDRKQRNLSVAWYADYDHVGCAYVTPSGTILFAKTFPGTDWVQAAPSYDGVVYLLHGMTATIRIVSKDMEEAIDISGRLDWASGMFVSSDGKYLVLCAGEQDIAPPYRVEVFDIESRQFVGSPFTRGQRTDFNTIAFAWDHESDALYLFHSDGLEAPATITRIDLADGVLTERYEVGMMSGRVFGSSADRVSVCVSSKAGLASSDPGLVQFMDPETGALEHLYVEPEVIGTNWPLYLHSDTHGAIYSWSTPYGDDDFRMSRIKSGELKWASHGNFAPLAYGEGFPVETETEEDIK